jgi:uncharacterized protein (DUF433 family)
VASVKPSDLRDGERIVIDSENAVGRPVIKGTSVTVEIVLDQLAADPDVDRLLATHPILSVDDVRAALAYARDLVGKERQPTRVDQAPLRTAGDALLALAALGKELGLAGPADLSARIDDELYGTDV